MIPNVSGIDLLLLLVIALLVFGPKKLPEIAAAIGKSVQSFKRGLNDLHAPSEDTKAPIRSVESASTDPQPPS